jgi:predicted permease
VLVINVVFPVFAIIALGYLLARSKQLDITTMSEIAVTVTSPCLIYTSIANRSIAASEWLVMGGAAVVIVFGSGVLMLLYQRANRLRSRGLYLPAMFMNSGNMALPFALLAFGTTGFDKAIIFFIVVAILNYSAGIFIAKGEGGFREIFRLPLIYAAIGGIASSVSGVKLPEFLMTPVSMLADMAIPLMILSLGAQLRSLKVSDVRHAVAGVGIRMGGGFLVALAFVTIFAVTGLSRNVIFLDALMPPAVTNVVLAQKYEANPDSVASAIVIGTLLSIVVTPIYLLLVT